jgi:hypothetical protein
LCLRGTPTVAARIATPSTVTFDVTEEAVPTERDEAPATHTSPLVYAGFGAAAVFGVVGSVTGLLAFSRASRAKESCDGTRCTSAANDDIDASRAWGTASTITFALAGAGAVVGVIGLFSGTPDKPATAGNVRLLIGATGITLAGAF